MSEFTKGQHVVIREGATWCDGNPVFAARDASVKGTVVQPEPDADGDVVVRIPTAPYSTGTADGVRDYYVFMDHVTPDLDQVDEETDEVDGVWMAWNGATIAAFKTEIEALRYAIRNGGSAEKVAYGEEVAI